MKLTPHYQQQVKQTTSHFFILPAKVFIHPAVKNPLCHCNARVTLLVYIYPRSPIGTAALPFPRAPIKKEQGGSIRASGNVETRERETTSGGNEIGEFPDKWVLIGPDAVSPVQLARRSTGTAEDRTKSARLGTRRGRHAAAIVPDLQLTRDAARRVCASFAPAHRILIPLRPLAGHSQLVSLSLPSRISVYLAFFRPRSRSTYPAPSFWLTVYLLFRRYQSVPPSPPPALSSLTPSYSRPCTHSHENFFLFYAALYRCSCLLTHSLLQFFRRSLRPSRGVSPVSSLSFLPFVRGKRSCSHPSSGFLSIPPIQLYPLPLVVPFICLPSPTAIAPTISTTYLTSRASFRRLYLKH